MTIGNCVMCGKKENLVNRWYQYDSGEQFVSLVCPNCVKLHTNLIKENN
jgi:hypothetical protein